MRKSLFVVCVLFLYKFSVGQIDSSDFKDHCFYVYKTEEDFFNKKKSYRGQVLPSENIKIIKYKTSNSKKHVLNLEDSCTYYYGYEIGGEIQIRPDKNPGSSTYYSFGGGTKDLYCVAYGSLANYDRKGFLLGLTSPTNITYVYFIDRMNKLYMVQIDEFLRSNPKLLQQFKSEKAKIKKQDWERNKLAIEIKYLKLFIEENK